MWSVLRLVPANRLRHAWKRKFLFALCSMNLLRGDLGLWPTNRLWTAPCQPCPLAWYARAVIVRLRLIPPHFEWLTHFPPVALDIWLMKFSAGLLVLFHRSVLASAQRTLSTSLRTASITPVLIIR